MRTPVCDLLGIEVPIIGAPFGPWDQVSLAASISEAGGLGSVGAAARPVDELKEQWRRLRELTDRPFAINHTMRPLDLDAFDASMAATPKAISFHMGVPADLISRAHEAGILWIQQVIDVDEAAQALAAGADVIIAQGGEAGGHGGWVSTMVLVPAVVDMAGDTPVVAAGGIVDGRGLAACLALGAQGVSMGTRFLASREMAIRDTWKQKILAADPSDAVKMINTERIFPPFSRDVTHAEPRSLRTSLVDQLATDPESVDPAMLGPILTTEIPLGGGDDHIPLAGQSAGLIHEILGAKEIVDRTISEARQILVSLASG